MTTKNEFSKLGFLTLILAAMLVSPSSNAGSDHVYVTEVDPAKTYYYTGPTLSRSYTAESYGKVYTARATLQSNSPVTGATLRNYLNHGILPRSTVVRKLSVLVAVSGAIGLGMGSESVEASTVRYKPADQSDGNAVNTGDAPLTLTGSNIQQRNNVLSSQNPSRAATRTSR